MNRFRAIQTLALRNVLEDTPDYRLRERLRWYSKTFHTPLPEVEALPVDDVLLAYYETVYGELQVAAETDPSAGAQLEAARKELAMTEVEAEEARRHQDLVDLQIEDELEMERKRAAAEAVKAQVPPPPPPVPFDTPISFDLPDENGLITQSSTK